MRPVDQSRQNRPRPAGWRDGLLLPVVALLALAGCESGYGSKQSDPFMGVHAAPTPVSSAGGGGTGVSSAGGTQTPTNNTIPPLPASHTVPSQSSLAGGTTQPPDDARTLRIETQPVVPVSSSGGPAHGVAPNNVQVEGPIPMPESTSKTMSAPIASAGMRPPDGAVAPPPPGGAMTFEQAQQQLKQRGVVWWRLDSDQGQCKFQCSLPLPGSKNMNSFYEAKAADPLSAARAVIEKIDKEQR